jgi:hypothetical protein
MTYRLVFALSLSFQERLGEFIGLEARGLRKEVRSKKFYD